VLVRVCMHAVIQPSSTSCIGPLPRCTHLELELVFLLVATDSSTGTQLLQPLLPSQLEKLHGVKHDGGSRRLISEP